MTNEQIIEAMAADMEKRHAIMWEISSRSDPHGVYTNYHDQLSLWRHDWREQCRAIFAVVEPAVRDQCAEIAKGYWVDSHKFTPRGLVDRIAAAIRNPEPSP